MALDQKDLETLREKRRLARERYKAKFLATYGVEYQGPHSRMESKVSRGVIYGKSSPGGMGHVLRHNFDSPGYFAARGAEERAGRFVGYVSGKDLQKIRRRWKNRCAVCGAEEPLAFDHIQPLTKGGLHSKKNLRLLCFPCNGRKRDQWPWSLEAARREIHVRRKSRGSPSRGGAGA